MPRKLGTLKRPRFPQRDYRERARALYAGPSDDDIEIDDKATVSTSPGEGAWVAAWVWVRDTDIDDTIDL